VSIGALFLGLAVVFAIAFAGNRGDDADRGRVRRRLSRYSLSPRSAAPSSQDSAAPGALGGSAVARSAVELAGRVTQSRDVDTMLGKQLDGAGVPMKPAEWALIHVGLTLGLGLLGLILSGFEILPAALGLIVGFVAPYLYLSYRRDKRCKEFDAALPDTLQLLAGSLAAGYSLPQAVDTVRREAQGVMATELNRAIVEARLGVPLEEALDDIAGRMASKDFSWVVMAIRITRDVGGNLAEVHPSDAPTRRERERLRRQVKALSAEGRLSAWILGALPVLFAVYLVLVRPEYVGKLFTTPVGLAMVVVGIGLLLVGAVWLRKVVTVEV
jgi:tight adherence protein B